jgi:outer membrane protein assembly factor BamB
VPRTPEPRRRFLRRASLAAAGLALAPGRPRAAAGQATAPRQAPAAAASGAATAPADAWPQFRGTPSLSGLSAATLPEKLTVAWQWEAGDAIESSAAISGGFVYVGTRAGELVSLDLAAGKPAWRYKVTGDGVGESSACVADGAVFVGDLAGVVHAVDAKSGKGLWTHKTGQEIKSSPVVSAGRVLVGSYDQSLYALDAKTGTLA